MKVNIVKEVKRSDALWRFACGDVSYEPEKYKGVFPSAIVLLHPNIGVPISWASNNPAKLKCTSAIRQVGQYQRTPFRKESFLCTCWSLEPSQCRWLWDHADPDCHPPPNPCQWKSRAPPAKFSRCSTHLKSEGKLQQDAGQRLCEKIKTRPLWSFEIEQVVSYLQTRHGSQSDQHQSWKNNHLLLGHHRNFWILWLPVDGGHFVTWSISADKQDTTDLAELLKNQARLLSWIGWLEKERRFSSGAVDSGQSTRHCSLSPDSGGCGERRPGVDIYTITTLCREQEFQTPLFQSLLQLS